MSERIDHAAEARRILSDVKPYRDQDLGVAMGSAQIHAILALVEQQRIANRLEYTRLAIEQYGNYAPGGANLPSLFAPPETEQGNVRVPESIAAALGIGDSDE